jgi:ADP-ribose pyrophosphatase YjhB (NUDIX family)
MVTTPEKMVARAVILKRQRRQTLVLLVRKKTEPHTYELPGGRRKRTEKWIEALTRELYEELGVRLNTKTCSKWGNGRMRTTHDSGTSVQVVLYKITDVGRVRPKSEIIECRWIPLADLARYPLERKSKIILWLYYRFGQGSR